MAAIELGLQEKLHIGNLDAKRDWGHARDFVRGMWLILQRPQPDDFVLATGETHSVREFIELAFAEVGRRIEWHGTGAKEIGRDATTGNELVRVHPRYFRASELDQLRGDASKARRELGWRPETSFQALVSEMVKSDLKTVAAEGRRKNRSSY